MRCNPQNLLYWPEYKTMTYSLKYLPKTISILYAWPNILKVHVCTCKSLHIFYHPPAAQACYVCHMSQYTLYNEPRSRQRSKNPQSNFHHCSQVPYCATGIKTGVHFKAKTTKRIFMYVECFSVNTCVQWSDHCSIIMCVHCSANTFTVGLLKVWRFWM